MPSASASELGNIFMYIGTTNANYTHGYVYECVSDGGDPAVYSWIRTNVQPITESGNPLGVYNVLDYGLVNDGSTDNSTALQNLINTVDSGSVIFFPQGIYVLQSQIVINNKNILFEGVTTEIYHKNTEHATYPESAILVGASFPTDTTVFVRTQGTERMTFKNMSFYAHELYKITENDATFSSVPYDYFKVVNSAESSDNPTNLTKRINGIDAPYFVYNCYFEGFSGFAIKIYTHKFVTNCSFYSCYTGIQVAGTDCAINKCWFNLGDTAIKINNESANYALANVSDAWCDAMMGHFIEADNTSLITINIDNAWVDMINKCGVYVPNGTLSESNINGRFSRCGMKWASTTDPITGVDHSESDVICTKIINNCEFNIIANKREVGGASGNPNGECPYRLLHAINSSVNNVRIITDMDISQISDTSIQGEVYPLSAEDMEYFKGGKYNIAKINFRTASPIGSLRAARANMLAFDYINHVLYRSTAANDNTAWEVVLSGSDVIYETMPNTATLLAMPLKSHVCYFETRGFWSSSDNCGGLYRIQDNTYGAPTGSLTITDGTTTRYLIPLNADGSLNGNVIDVGRFGIRAVANFSNKDDTASDGVKISVHNSQIFSLINAKNKQTLKFGDGIYVFENPISYNNGLFSIQGSEQPNPEIAQSNTYYNYGTVLYFPNLTAGDTAITLRGNISDVAIVGSESDYNLVIDRDKVTVDTSQVVTETVGKECTGLDITGSSNFVKNVIIKNFYIGCVAPTGSHYIHNFYARECNIGLQIENDVKCVGVYGWNVDTLLQIKGSLSSAVQVRGDSCVHLININAGRDITVVDADGDWCTEELITIGADDANRTIDNIRLDGIHGRYCALNYYNTDTKPNGYDIRTIVSEEANTNGYGMIRVLPNTIFKDSYISVNGLTGHLLDKDDPNNPGIYNKLWMPNILFTFNKNTTSSYPISNIQFVAPFINSKEDILKIVQTNNYVTLRIDSPTNTYYINGTNVDDSLLCVTTLPTANASNVGLYVLYTGATDTTTTPMMVHCGIYECCATSGSTPTYYWVCHSVTIEMLQNVVSASNDFNDFKTIVAQL